MIQNRKARSFVLWGFLIAFVTLFLVFYLVGMSRDAAMIIGVLLVISLTALVMHYVGEGE